MKGDCAALIAHTNPFPGFTVNLNLAPWEPCLHSEDAPSSLLAGKAVADRHTPRLALCLNAKLTAATSGCSHLHVRSAEGLTLTPNVEVTGAAQLYRAASGGPPGWASLGQFVTEMTSNQKQPRKLAPLE